MTPRTMKRLLGTSSALMFLAGPVWAETEDAATDERLGAVERAVQVLSEEQDRLRTALAVPEDGELTSFSGLGPAASKVYGKEVGLSLGGYGEWQGNFKVDDKSRDDKNVLDALRAVLYVGYKFNDWILVNSEFEFEHAGSGGGGSVSTEFLTLDFLFAQEVNVRAGLLLLPMGFINEIHEPVYFFGTSRPEVERQIIPTTWRENGAGIFGSLGDVVHYRMYGVNGFKASGYTSEGFRGGRQKGSEAVAENFAFVARVDVTPVEGFLIGGSVYTGKAGQDERLENGEDVPGTLTTIFEFHAELKRCGATLRALYTQSHIQNAGELNRALDLPEDDGVASGMRGGYAEVAYDILPLFDEDTEMSLEPFYRYEYIDTNYDPASGFTRNKDRRRTYQVVGANFYPHPQVVVKLDYRNIKTHGPGGEADEVQVGFGYVF